MIEKENTSQRKNIETTERTSHNEKEPVYSQQYIDYIFTKNPELAEIGTKEEYIEYLQSVFPESKVPQILWHSSQAKKINEPKVTNYDNDLKKNFYGFYMSDYDQGIYGGNLFGIRVNVHKGKEVDAMTIVAFTKEDYERLKAQEIDCVYAARTADGEYEYSEIVVFEPEKIKILGSENDVEDFRKWKKTR